MTFESVLNICLKINSQKIVTRIDLVEYLEFRNRAKNW